MRENESKNDRFRRLAKLRGERILRDLRLIGNLSNLNNYEYSNEEVKKIFSSIEEELKLSRQRFSTNKKLEINL